MQLLNYFLKVFEKIKYFLKTTVKFFAM